MNLATTIDKFNLCEESYMHAFRFVNPYLFANEHPADSPLKTFDALNEGYLNIPGRVALSLSADQYDSPMSVPDIAHYLIYFIEEMQDVYTIDFAAIRLTIIKKNYAEYLKTSDAFWIT